MEYKRAKTSDLPNIAPDYGLNSPDLQRSISSDDSGIGEPPSRRTRSATRKNQPPVFMPKKGALKRKGAIRKKQNQISPKLQRLREKAKNEVISPKLQHLREKSRGELKKQGIIGPRRDSFNETEEHLDGISTSTETDRPDNGLF